MTSSRPSRTWTGFVLVAFAALLGFWLMYLPTLVAGQYETVSQAGGIWATLYLASVITGGVILASCSLWIVIRLWRSSRRKARRKVERNRNPSQMSAAERSKEINDNLNTVRELGDTEAIDPEVQAELSPLVGRFEEKQESQKLEIVAFGTVSSGKSAVLNLLAGRQVFQSDARGGTTVTRGEIPWVGDDRVVLVDTPGLGEIDGAEHVAISAEAARDADLVLLVVDGPLRDHEFRLLETLGNMEKPFLLAVNKSDWFSEQDRESLLGQISKQLTGVVAREDIVTIQAAPATRRRVRVLSDGSEVDDEVEVPADIEPLTMRMQATVAKDGQDLLLANLLLQSRGLVEQAKERVRKSLDKRAWAIVDRYMWGAGGAAALSPLPFVDLLAGCAISSKMVVDLAKVYRQDIDLQIAVNLLGQLGKNLIGILGVSAATPAVTAIFASTLKSVPGIGTIAGGLLQGVVQALITRWIGAVFIEYFRSEMQEPEGGLAGLARRQWTKMTTAAELRKLVQAARREWKSNEDDNEAGDE